MVKIAYASDLHLEFGWPKHSAFDSDADYLFLAGDIIEAKWMLFAQNPDSEKFEEAQQLTDLFQYLSDTYKHVYLILGNHEYYSSRIDKTPITVRNYLEKFDNITLLHGESVQIPGVGKVYGHTFWTSMGHPMDRWQIGRTMNDFKAITYKGARGYTKFTPDQAAAIHAQQIDKVIQEAPDVILMHHAPSQFSLSKYYRENSNINDAYYSKEFEIRIREGYIKPKLIIHGHVHQEFDYDLDGVRVICNPRGYVGFEADPDWKVKTHLLKT